MRVIQDGQLGWFARSRIGNLILNLTISAERCVSRSVFDGLKVGQSEGKDVRSLIQSDKIRGLGDAIIEEIQDRTFFGSEGKMLLQTSYNFRANGIRSGSDKTVISRDQEKD